MERKGFLVTIASPSGGGKSSVCHELLKRHHDLCYSVSWTTRPKRGMEIDSQDYFFTDLLTFQNKVSTGFFLEYALVHGNYYGTPESFVTNQIRQGKIVLFDIDVQGVEIIKKRGEYDIVTIFLLPPNERILQERLINRGTDTTENIAIRIANAHSEIIKYVMYDYLVINDQFETTMRILSSILDSEKHRVKRYIDPVTTFYPKEKK